LALFHAALDEIIVTDIRLTTNSEFKALAACPMRW
jgi:hypothetical protein